jgi:hypothetical protein
VKRTAATAGGGSERLRRGSSILSISKLIRNFSHASLSIRQNSMKNFILFLFHISSRLLKFRHYYATPILPNSISGLRKAHILSASSSARALKINGAYFLTLWARIFVENKPFQMCARNIHVCPYVCKAKPILLEFEARHVSVYNCKE